MAVRRPWSRSALHAAGWLAVICAVLSGLFLMHGVTAATAGCNPIAGPPPAMAMAGPAMAAGKAAAQPPVPRHGTRASAPAGDATAAPASTAVPGADAAAHGGMLCTSLPPRGHPAGALLAASAVAVAVGLAWWPGGGAAASRHARKRGPPGTPGKRLLVLAGVSRT